MNVDGTGVTFLLHTIGPRLTAAGLGMVDARDLLPLMDVATSVVEEPFRGKIAAMVEVVDTLAGVGYSGAVAASFLRSSQPDLDDRAPVMMIREATSETLDGVRAVIRMAAAGFVS